MISRLFELIEANPKLLSKEEQEALAEAKSAPKLSAEDEQKIAGYEKRLEGNMWLGGSMPSQDDKAALDFFKTVSGENLVQKYPNVFNWYSLASKFTEAKTASWPAADDCDDLFGSDDDDDEASFDALCKAKQAAIDKANSKAKATAKSIILWEVKPLESETDLDALAQRIMKISQDGLVWKAEYKKEPVAFGVFKLIIGAVLEDEKVSTDDL